jgi:hypothetical protein
VIAVSAVPGLGAAAYVLARPLRRNNVLLGAVLDQAFRLLPLRLYDRFHLRPVTVDIARRDASSEPGLRERLARLPSALASLAPHGFLLALLLGANVALLAGAGMYFAANGSLAPFTNHGAISILMVAEALAAGVMGILYYRRFWARSDSDDRPGAAGTLFWLGGGLALVWLAIDQFLGAHQAIGRELDGVPVLEHADDLVLLGYLICGVVFVRMFGHELESHGPSFVLLAAAVLMAAATVILDALLDAGSDWMALERAGQMLTVGLILPAFLIRYRELQGEAG